MDTKRVEPVSGELMASLPEDVDMEQIDRLLRVSLPVIVVLAEKEMRLEEILSLGKDSVISFKKLNNEPLEFYVNDRLLGNGKAIKVGERFGIYMNRVDSPEEALRKLADDVA